MIWVAVEDTGTCEVSEFEPVSEDQVRYLMDGYKVDKHDVARVRLQDTEGGSHVIYKGLAYKGGFGYNLWVAHKYVEM